jgi:hypothetical protein
MMPSRYSQIKASRVRAQTTLGKFDFSAMLVKEVAYLEDALTGIAEYRRSWYAGLDRAGAIWDFGVYAEAALRLPADAEGKERTTEDFDFEKALEIAVGFDYVFTALDDLELWAEYYHRGPGESDSELAYEARDNLKLQLGAGIPRGPGSLRPAARTRRRA